jgi:predicted lactoylglutathione lyase
LPNIERDYLKGSKNIPEGKLYSKKFKTVDGKCWHVFFFPKGNN